MSAPTPAPELSIVVLSWNTKDLLEACLSSLRALGDRVSREVIVVDNASEDGSADHVASRHAWCLLIRNERNEGYARGNNVGIRAASGSKILLLNSDTEVQEGALDRLCAFLDEHPEHGAVGGGLRNPDGSIQPACMRFPTLLTALFFDMELERRWPENPATFRYFMRDYDHATSRDVDQPPGACLLVRRSALERIGLFDETLWLYFNDVDLCQRLWKAGYRIHYLVEACVVHRTGSSTKRFTRRVLEWQRNRRAYYRKWYGWFGERWIRLMIRWRALEERARIARLTATAADRSAARRELRELVRETMLPIEFLPVPGLDRDASTKPLR
ncbi:MAG: glycosyltransferase family 2 protein [Planctomycetes bacterium]|nr:glycosyltransferase family 2 protein [Planctomycetota bacterium]